MLLSKGTVRTAGSRFITYGGERWAWRWELIRCMKVVLPEPVRAWFVSIHILIHRGPEGEGW